VEPQDVEGLSTAIVRFFREDRSAEFRAAIERTQVRFGWQNLIDAVLKPVV
jgi:hypothetical protein